MTKVTVIGLGPMGAALARLLVSVGGQVMVWNTTPRLDAVPGATVAGRLEVALQASPLILICVRDIAAARAVLEPQAQALAGRVLLNLSTGSPADAQAMAAWVAAQGCGFVDGAVMNAPDQMGGPGSRILLAGPAATVAGVRNDIACLAEDIRHVGPSFRAAKAMYHAYEMLYFGHLAAALQAADICLSEGVALTHLHALHDASPTHQGYIQTLIDGHCRPANMTLEAWASDLAMIRKQAAEAGISSPFPDMLSVLFDRAIAAGHGQDDVMAIWKTLT